MDPLSVTASIIAVLQATSAVISICYNYTSNTKNSSSQQSKVLEETKSLRNILEALESLARGAENTGSGDDSRPPNIKTLRELVEEPLAGCLYELEVLRERLGPPNWIGKDGSRRQALVQALRWPLNEGDTKKALENIERFKTTLNLALTTHHSTLASAIHAQLQSNYKEATEARKDIERKQICQWLSAPDPSLNHNDACKKRHSTTGTWFLNSQEFVAWKETPNSLLWLYGIPGCGKTVLSSTIIEHLIWHSQPPKGLTHVAYFYFDFNDSNKQQHEGMIRSLITQLFLECKTNPEALLTLYSSCNNGQQQPKLDELMKTLESLIKAFGQIYIILDALDECEKRHELLKDIQQICQWQTKNLHLLVTSRRESDIEESLRISIEDRDVICIQGSPVDEDIRAYTHARIHTDSKLKRWRNHPQVQEEIEKSLTEKSFGMFRWAVCQLDALVKCYNLVSLRKALASLPRTLDQTYDRILCSIDEENRQDTLRILQWLVCSVRPLKIHEVAEILTVDINANPKVDIDKRFPDPQEALAPCSSLVAIAEETLEVRLAHFSVQEYLVSRRIDDGPASQYRVTELEADEEIARTCIAYILQFQFLKPLPHNTLEEFALAQYALENWTYHAREVEGDDSILELMMELLGNREAYLSIFELQNLQSMLTEEAHSPLYHASCVGLYRGVMQLIERGADVNAQGGVYGNALQAALLFGHEAIAKLLIEKGADVNAQGGICGNALQAALLFGHEAIAKLLIEKGADVNTQGGVYGNALRAAVRHGRDSIVELLLKHGATE